MIRLPDAWLTRHALDRAREMGVTTDRLVRIAHRPHLVLPDPQRNPARRMLRSLAEPDLAVIVDASSQAIITALWWSPEERFVRPTPGDGLALIDRAPCPAHNPQEDPVSEMANTAAPAPSRTFDDIADEQGWTDASRLAVLLSFIEANGYHPDLAEHASSVADTENGYDTEVGV